MIRFLYTICDLFAGIFAIVSPVAIFHWLAKAAGLQATMSLINALNPVFDPLNALLERFIQLPHLNYQGQDISTTQGLLACILTAGFFLFNFLSESLKATEQRLEVTKQAFIQKNRLQQLKKEEQKRQQQAVVNRRLCVQVQYDFGACPAGGAFFETQYKQLGGKIANSLPSTMALEFDTLDHAFKYCLEAAQSILGHYATLRPMDPQPPYQISINAVDMSIPLQDAMSKTIEFVKYAGANHIIFGEDVRNMMEVQGLSMNYHYQSLGMYNVDHRSQELYRLFYAKRQSGF